MANLSNLNNKFLVTTGGDVGIGTTSPRSKLEVNGGIMMQNGENLEWGDTYANNAPTIFASTNYLQFAPTGASGVASNSMKLTTTGLGIGLTSPTEKLDVEGNIQAINTAGSSVAYIDIVSGGTWRFASNPTSGTNAYGLNIIKGSAGSDVKMAIDTNGNVGIGTTSPYAFDTTATKLHVKNESAGSGNVGEVARFEGSSDASGSGGTIRLGTSNDRGIYFEGGRTGSVPYGIIGTTEYNGAKTYNIYLQNSGNVGIGTTSPAQKLEIAGGYLKFSGGDYGLKGSASLTYDPVSDHYFQSSGSTKVTFKADGKVGIGTTSPSQMLEIYTGGFAYARFKSASYGATGFDIGQHTGGSIYLNNRDNTAMVFMTNNTERMNILAGGTGTFYNAFSIQGDDKSLIVRNAAGTVIGTMGAESSSTPNVGMTTIRNNGTTTIQFNSNGSSYINGGNVGIGTSSPASKLDINGGRIGIRNNIVAASNLTYSTIYSTENTGAAYPFTGTSGNLVVEPRNGQDFVVLGTSGVARMVVQGGGNVGIGTASPTSTLSVKGTTNNGINVIGVGTTANRCYVGLNASNHGQLFVTGSSGQSPSLISSAGVDSYISGGNVGIGTTTPQTKLDVRGVITAGDSTTDNTIRRKHQSFATMKPGPTSGGSVDMMFVDHTHALDITVMAYVNTSNVATGRGYSVAAYGSTSTGLTQTAFAGVISALSISYVNTGGSENYVLRVTTTYSGATAPTLSVTATGQSSSKLRAAT